MNVEKIIKEKKNWFFEMTNKTKTLVRIIKSKKSKNLPTLKMKKDMLLIHFMEHQKGKH